MRRLFLFFLLSACVSAQDLAVSVSPTVVEFEDALSGTGFNASVMAQWETWVATEVTIEFQEESWAVTSPERFNLEPGKYMKELSFRITVPIDAREGQKERILLKTKSLTTGIGTEVIIPIEIMVGIGSDPVPELILSSMGAGYDGQEILGELFIENKGNSYGETDPHLQLLGRSMGSVAMEIPAEAEGVEAYTRKAVTFSFPVQLLPGEYFLRASIGNTTKLKAIIVPEEKKNSFPALPAGAAFLILTAFLLWRRS